MKISFFALLFCCCLSAAAQNTLKINVSDSSAHEPIIGAAVQIEGSTLGNVTDTEGSVTFQNLPNGKIILNVSFVGYQSKRIETMLPQNGPLSILLVSDQAELETAIVTSTRTNSRIEDIATKVEVLGADDTEEENSIKPANIASLLGDLSVIHIQQNSAVSGGSSVRMQGLDGKYTQILRDGLPLYEGFSGSFGVLQIPPLDLKQIEIIKGSNSTLYGGGAIGGMINLVSKEPTEETEVSLTANQSSLKESNLNGYYAKRKDKIGLTLFVGNTFQKAIDVNNDGFSDVPSVTSTILHPRFFYYFNPKTTLKMGINSVFENRSGGDMTALNYKPSAAHPFFEKNISQRNSFDFQFITNINGHNWTTKGALNLFNRSTDQSGFLFQGRQTSNFYETSDYIKIKNHDLVFGTNFVGDKFEKTASDSSAINFYNNQTVGFFIQDGWQITPKFLIEMGFRSDFLSRKVETDAAQNTFFALPRLAFLLKATPDFSIRLSGSTGYKTPNVFTVESLSGSFKNLPPLSKTIVSERSTSINGDLNYHTLLGGKVGMWLNQAFYFTDISNPIILQNNALVNSPDKTRSVGSDTYIRLKVSDLEMYFGYNHTLSTLGSRPVLFAPRDKFSMTMSYEIEHLWRFGIESSWVGNQYINETATAPNYWFWAGMIERKLGNKVSVVLNAENLLDVRQSRRESLFTGSIQQPTFKNLYMPIDGRVVNLAARVKL